MVRILLAIVAAFCPLLAAVFLVPAKAAQEKRLTLMTELTPWMYPGAELAGGASMSDGGNHEIPSVKCQAVMTTPDPVEKVVAFYSEKFPACRGEDDATGAAKPEASKTDFDHKSVSTLDDSKGRPLTLKAIIVHRADTSTTLIISRAEGESRTHIAWSHYVRLREKP